jgi:uncharacterized protein
VVSSGDTIVGVEVKAARLGRPGLTRSARSFVEAYAPMAFLVVNRGVQGEQDLRGTGPRWIPPQDVAAAIGALVR